MNVAVPGSSWRVRNRCIRVLRYVWMGLRRKPITTGKTALLPSCCRAPAIGAGMLVAAFTSLMKTLQKIGEKSMMNLKIGDIVKAKDCELRLVVVGASDKGYDLFSVWPYNDRFIYWEVDLDGNGDILSVVPDPDWDAKKITNRQKKNRKGRYLT